MKAHALLTLTISALHLTSAATTLKQDFNEVFASFVPRNDTTSPCAYYGCGDDLSQPVNALKWSNLFSLRKDTVPDLSRSIGLLLPAAPDQAIYYPYPSAIWYGRFSAANKPAVLSSKYNGSRVKDWKLHGFAAGCSSPSFDVGPASCNITVEGYDRDGNCVGTEFYEYIGVYHDTYYPPDWLMSVYNTTKDGLKGKYVQKVSISVTSTPANATDDPGFEAAIWGVSYTVFNKTASA